MTLNLTPYGLGKFSTIVDSMAYAVSLAGCDDETGDVEEGGWYGLLRGAIKVDPPFADLTVQQDQELSADDRTYLAAQKGGAILAEDSQGFVSVEWFATAAALDRRWGELSR